MYSVTDIEKKKTTNTGVCQKGMGGGVRRREDIGERDWEIKPLVTK